MSTQLWDGEKERIFSELIEMESKAKGIIAELEQTADELESIRDYLTKHMSEDELQVLSLECHLCRHVGETLRYSSRALRGSAYEWKKKFGEGVK